MASPPRPNRSIQLLMSELKSAAQTQAGVLHRDQLLERGLTADRIRDWVAYGWLEKRFRWTYAFPGTGRDLRTRAWSAQLSAGGDAAATSSHALALMDVIPERSGAFECVRSDGRPRRQRGLVVHETHYLPSADVRLLDGIRHTAFPRAVLDLAATAPLDTVARALDRGTRLREFDRRAFERLQAEYPRAAGHPTLAAALARLDHNTGVKRSELERLLIELVLGSSIPTPLVNSMVGEDEVDIRWINTRAIVEADGAENHSTPADIAADIAKRKRLEALGFVVMRVDWNSTVYQPEPTLQRIDAFRLANLAPPVPKQQHRLAS